MADQSEGPAPVALPQRLLMEQLMFGTGRVRRFTQDSPVLPDVWLAYAGVNGDDEGTTERATEEFPFGPVKLLLTPFRENSAGEVRKFLVERLAAERESRGWRGVAFGHSREFPRVAYNQTTVAATLYFVDLVRVVLPMSEWWARVSEQLPSRSLHSSQMKAALVNAVQDPEHATSLPHPSGRLSRPGTRSRNARRHSVTRIPPALLWTIRVVGTLAIVHRGRPLPSGFQGRSGVAQATGEDWEVVVNAFLELIDGLSEGPPGSRIFSVSRNRVTTPAIARSTLAVKADAARRLFDISCRNVAWAIIDSGVDAQHPAFRVRDSKGAPATTAFTSSKGGVENRTRVVETYDFTQIELLLDPGTDDEPTLLTQRLRKSKRARRLREQLDELKDSLISGRNIDWKVVAPLLRVPHSDAEYVPPAMDHGTHVAGILAGDWRSSDPRTSLEEDLTGICPDLRVYDLRVLNADGRGDEFSVMAALQFVRYLNSTNDYVVVHGVNLSLSIRHDIANYACGRTPVCDECERLVSAGIVVVAAAGNQGYRKYTSAEGVTTEAYNSISITDPGNAELVITVGATHRYRPHTYGVSYFSSRGPTGDGRRKPDLVAPGEKITGPLPLESFGSKDGTSMAAPHVSGAAALLLARHNELIGQTARIKQILCETATDLGRERYFQGAGMLDILRALQSL